MSFSSYCFPPVIQQQKYIILIINFLFSLTILSSGISSSMPRLWYQRKEGKQDPLFCLSISNSGTEVLCIIEYIPKKPSSLHFIFLYYPQATMRLRLDQIPTQGFAASNGGNPPEPKVRGRKLSLSKSWKSVKRLR